MPTEGAREMDAIHWGMVVVFVVAGSLLGCVLLTGSLFPFHTARGAKKRDDAFTARWCERNAPESTVTRHNPK